MTIEGVLGVGILFGLTIFCVTMMTLACYDRPLSKYR